MLFIQTNKADFPLITWIQYLTCGCYGDQFFALYGFQNEYMQQLLKQYSFEPIG